MRCDVRVIERPSVTIGWLKVRSENPAGQWILYKDCPHCYGTNHWENLSPHGLGVSTTQIMDLDVTPLLTDLGGGGMTYGRNLQEVWMEWKI